MAKLPILYAVVTNEGTFDYFVVKIASPFSYSDCNTEWMDDPELPPGLTLTAGLDLQESSHRFSKEKEALDFIAQWWKKYATFEACMALYNNNLLYQEVVASALPLSGPAPGAGAGG